MSSGFFFSHYLISFVLRFDPAVWTECDDILIDYAVIEHADNLIDVRLSTGRSDLGVWNAVWKRTRPRS